MVADVDVGITNDSIAARIRGLTLEGDEIDEINPNNLLPTLDFGELEHSRKQATDHKALRRTKAKSKSKSKWASLFNFHDCQGGKLLFPSPSLVFFIHFPLHFFIVQFLYHWLFSSLIFVNISIKHILKIFHIVSWEFCILLPFMETIYQLSIYLESHILVFWKIVHDPNCWNVR